MGRFVGPRDPAPAVGMGRKLSAPEHHALTCDRTGAANEFRDTLSILIAITVVVPAWRILLPARHETLEVVDGDVRGN